MAILLLTDGTAKRISPKNKREFTLQELYDHLDCTCIERSCFEDNRDIWFDEEGRVNKKDFNVNATTLLRRNCLGNIDIIVGSAIICQREEVK